MAGTDHPDGESGQDEVERARAWLVEHTGQAPEAGEPEVRRGPHPSVPDVADAGGPVRPSRSADAGRRTQASGPTEASGPTHASWSSGARGPSEASGSSQASWSSRAGGQTESRASARADRRARTRGPGGGNGSTGQDGPDDPDADHEAVARTIALRKLTAQARTRHELDQALQKKNVPDEVAATVLDRLEEVGLVDDETFAQDWVASRQQRRHLSRSALRRELQRKGVDRDHVDSALSTVDADDELAAARALVAKKAPAMQRLEPMVRKRRLAGTLARRGFGPGIIGAALSELGGDGADDPGA